MAKKKTKSRKTTKKSGTKRKKAPIRVPRKKGKKSSARANTGLGRAKKVRKKKIAKKTKRKRTSKKTPKKRKTAAERRNERAAHPSRRKPETGGRQAKHEILEFFGATDLTKLTKKELIDLKLAFLRAYANRGIIRDGVLAAGISWKVYDRWREQDEGFNEGCKHAELLAADRLEAEAHRRAFDGYSKPVIYQGEITETYTEYSDSLMQTLMKGYKRDKYKDRQEHSGSVGRPMTLDDETKESVVSSILGMIKNKPDPK